MAKSAALVPLIPILLMRSGAVPVAFEIVTTWAGVLVVVTCWLPKESATGVTARTGETPVPVRAMFGWIFAGSVVLKVKVPARAPNPVGLKITLIVQLNVAAIVPPQVLVWIKSEGFRPVNETLLTTSGTAPALVMVTTWAALLVPTSWLPNESASGAMVALGAAPTWATLDHSEESVCSCIAPLAIYPLNALALIACAR